MLFFKSNCLPLLLKRESLINFLKQAERIVCGSNPKPVAQSSNVNSWEFISKVCSLYCTCELHFIVPLLNSYGLSGCIVQDVKTHI